MSNAEMTGLRPDIVVEMITSSIPYDVTELEPKGTQSAAPNAMTNTANTISQGYDFFSSKYEKMMAGSGTQHFTLSVVITAVTLFTLGTVKSTFGAGVWWESGAEVTGIGGAAACVAFYTAKLVDFLVEKSGLVGGM